MDSDLLQILCCPETHQALRLAEPNLIETLNRQIAAGTLKNRAGQPVTETLDAGLIRADQKFLYPIRNNIPVMLVDEAIAVLA
jgi:uncharacterized protein YbaR (Trm112 family)